MPELEVITMGRVSVDLYPEQIGVPMASVRSFVKSIGGSPTNVAVAAARLGHRVALITRVGNDPFGKAVLAALSGFGVDTRWVGIDSSLRTPLAFCEIYPPDYFPIFFYREPRAPDLNIRVEDLDLDAIAAVRILWTTATGLSDEPSRSATLAAMARRSSTDITVFDLDYRPMLWKSETDARNWTLEGIGRATVVIGNLEEAALVAPASDPTEASRHLLTLGPRLVVIKLGSRGAVGRTANELEEVPGVPVEVLCGLGAGDAFGGAFCHGLLMEWDLASTLRFSAAAGAIVASRLTCSDAMPTVDEVESLAAKASRG